MQFFKPFFSSSAVFKCLSSLSFSGFSCSILIRYAVSLSFGFLVIMVFPIEEFFEAKLFDKMEGAIRLTPAGKILYKNAKHILEHYTDVEKEINKITGMLKGGITLGASTTLGNYILQSVITEFKKRIQK